MEETGVEDEVVLDELGITSRALYYRFARGWRESDAVHLAAVLGCSVRDLEVPK
jgi:hypothetical protein